MIAGIVSGSGRITSGAGFALTRTGPGVYTIRFLEPCAQAPLVLATPAEPALAIAATGTPTGAEITLTDMSGARTDAGFAFAAMIPPAP
jgi:hypothetical protein